MFVIKLAILAEAGSLTAVVGRKVIGLAGL